MNEQDTSAAGTDTLNPLHVTYTVKRSGNVRRTYQARGDTEPIFCPRDASRICNMNCAAASLAHGTDITGDEVVTVIGLNFCDDVGDVWSYEENVTIDISEYLTPASVMPADRE